MNVQRGILVAAVTLGLGWGWLQGGFDLPGGVGAAAAPVPPRDTDRLATFAAGCFWSAEAAFEGLPGVRDVVAGFTGGRVPHPDYKLVASGATGHAEAVQVRFDPGQVTYEQLLERYWRNVDPFEAHRQFCDLGDSYRPVIFVHDAGQRAAAEQSRAAVQRRFARPVVVTIAPAAPFYPADAVHQDYARTHPIQYQYYRWACGKDSRLREIWGG